MSVIINLDEIKHLLPRIDLLTGIEMGFAAYSRGEVVVPPVGELVFQDPPGEVHIKYGYIKADDFYVIKIASGFYDNSAIGRASSQGLMLIFNQKTGVLEAMLLDEGFLTDIRTAAAGAVAARHLAPNPVHRIGILGAGTQARWQLDLLQTVTPCRSALVWVPDPKEEAPYLEFFEDSDFQIEVARTPAEVAGQCNLVVTTTPSTEPLLHAHDIQPGTHITAVGSDTAYKIELAPEILEMAHVVVADSLAQSESRGEIYRAVEAGALPRHRVVELGNVITDPILGRTTNQEITVSDLTGVAVQDIQIATAVFAEYQKQRDGART